MFWICKCAIRGIACPMAKLVVIISSLSQLQTLLSSAQLTCVQNTKSQTYIPDASLQEAVSNCVRRDSSQSYILPLEVLAYERLVHLWIQMFGLLTSCLLSAIAGLISFAVNFRSNAVTTFARRPLRRKFLFRRWPPRSHRNGRSQEPAPGGNSVRMGFLRGN